MGTKRIPKNEAVDLLLHIRKHKSAAKFLIHEIIELLRRLEKVI
jgi:hypothetical protein